MRWNQICLRVMLWSLGMSAAVGVATIFASSSTMIFRLLWTSIATAIAAGIMWPLTMLADRPNTRVAGLLGMAAVLLDFFLGLVLIWGQLAFRETDFRIEEAVLMTFFWVMLAATPAVIFLLFLEVPAGWLVARFGTAACALMFIELMVSTWLGRNGRFIMMEGRWAEAAGLTALYGFLAVACLAGRLDERPWRWAGVGAALVAWGMATLHTFQDTHSKFGEALFVVLTTVAAVVGYANLCMLPALSPVHEIFRRGTILLGILTAALVDAIALDSILGSSGGAIDDFLSRLAAASGIVTACGTVAILILALIHKSHQPRPALALGGRTWDSVQIVCPRCGKEQELPRGDSACSRCQLEFSIWFGERRPRSESTIQELAPNPPNADARIAESIQARPEDRAR